MSEVFAVKEKSEIETIGKILNKQHGRIYSDIWHIGINMALRITDMLSIKYDDVIGNDHLTIKEQKTRHVKNKKPRRIMLNSKAKSIIAGRRLAYPDDVYLFRSHSNRAKIQNSPITVRAVLKAFASAGDVIGLKLGTHSMRKTRGYHLYNDGMKIEEICKVLNHANPSMTMAYIGLDQDMLDDSFKDYVL